MRCGEALCGGVAEPGGTRCGPCARWAARAVAEEDRDRRERAAAADAEWVATVTARHAGEGGWRCTAGCVPCARGLGYGNEQPYLLDGRLFDHARRRVPVARGTLPPVGQVV